MAISNRRRGKSMNVHGVVLIGEKTATGIAAEQWTFKRP
jgi:hypothetical protein